MTKIDIAALSNHPVFLGTAKAETMLRDFDRHRMAVRDHDSEAAEKTWDMCERWVDQLKPLTEGDVRAAILSLAAENERLRETLGRTAEQALMEEIPEHSRGSFDDAAFNRGYDAAISAARAALTGSQP